MVHMHGPNHNTPTCRRYATEQFSFDVGLVELITESETLRKIQVQAGVTGSFKDRPIKEWLQGHNPTELEYQKVSTEGLT